MNDEAQSTGVWEELDYRTVQIYTGVIVSE